MVVLFLFRKSENMEHAYGLSITITMLMTTLLVGEYMKRKHYPLFLIVVFMLIFGLIELTFLAGNLPRILHGGWFTILLGSSLFSVMWAWSRGRTVRNRYTRFVELEDYLPIIQRLNGDTSIPKYASQLVYLTSSNFHSEIEQSIVYSIIQKNPKRADVYWLLHVDVTDEPFTMEYKVSSFIPGKLIRIDFKLGFKVEPRISGLFRSVVEELVERGEVNISSRYESLRDFNIPGDFKFIVIEKVLSDVYSLNIIDRVVMAYHQVLRKIGLSDVKTFGLDLSSVAEEKVPLIVDLSEPLKLKRVG
jgi:KUP system potassium uptake protein